MTKEIAHMIATRLIDLEFVDYIAGIAQPVSDTKVADDTGKAFVKKLPVSYDFIKRPNDIKGTERDLVPNSAYKGLLYFEDNGAQLDNNKSGGRNPYWNARIRLICWMNKKQMVESRYTEMTGVCIAEIQKALRWPRGIAAGGFNSLFVTSIAVVEQSEAIFARYNYDAKESAYLRPPYEYFALDLGLSYRISPLCSTKITFKA